MKNEFAPEALKSEISTILKGLELTDSLFKNNKIKNFDISRVDYSYSKLSEAYLERYSQGSSELRQLMILLFQELTIHYPKIYMYRTKKNNNDTYYFNAKVHWLLKDGTKKEIAVYVGKANDFNNDTNNSDAHFIARKKIKELLTEKRVLNEI